MIIVGVYKPVEPDMFFIDYPEILESDIERLLCYLIKVKSERDYYSKLCIEAASRRTFDKEYENLTNMIN